MSRTSAPPALEGNQEAVRAALPGFAPGGSSSSPSPSPTPALLESESSSPAISPSLVSTTARAARAASAGSAVAFAGGFVFGGGRLTRGGRGEPATRVGSATSFFAGARLEPAGSAARAFARVASVSSANGSNGAIRPSGTRAGEAATAAYFASSRFASPSFAPVSPSRARRAASRPSPFAAHRASTCRNALVRSGSAPATILSGLAIVPRAPESIATHAMIFVRYATFASLSRTLALLFSRASNRSDAYPVLRCTSDTTSCRNRNGGFFNSASVSCVAEGHASGAGGRGGRMGQRDVDLCARDEVNATLAVGCRRFLGRGVSNARRGSRTHLWPMHQRRGALKQLLRQRPVRVAHLDRPRVRPLVPGPPRVPRSRSR